jgi:hypothetical protein
MEEKPVLGYEISCFPILWKVTTITYCTTCTYCNFCM